VVQRRQPVAVFYVHTQRITAIEATLHVNAPATWAGADVALTGTVAARGARNQVRLAHQHSGTATTTTATAAAVGSEQRTEHLDVVSFERPIRATSYRDWSKRFAHFSGQHGHKGNFLNFRRRVAAVEKLAQDAARRGYPLDKDARPRAYRARMELLIRFLPALFADYDGDMRGALETFLLSKVFTLKFGKLFFEPIKKLGDFRLKHGAYLYFYVSGLGKRKYRELRTLSKLPPKLQRTFGTSKYFLPSYTAILAYAAEHFSRNMEQHTYQPTAMFDKKGGPVITGGGIDMTRTPVSVLTKSLDTLKRFHQQNDNRGWVVLERIKLKVLAATVTLPQPTELDWQIAEQRKFLCDHTDLGETRNDAAFGLCSDGGYWSSARLQVKKKRGNSPHDTDYVVLLELKDDDDYNQIKDGRSFVPNSLVAQRVAALGPFKPVIPKDWALTCDADGTHVMARPDALRGQAGYTSTTCISGGWKKESGMWKNMAFAQFVSIVPGDDTVKTIKTYSDSVGGRARWREESTAVIYDADSRPWILNPVWVTDSKTAQSLCGSGSAVSGRHIPGYTVVRDDTRSITDPENLSGKFDWAGKACSSSRFFELAELLTSCSASLQLALGLEYFQEHFPPCLKALDADPRVRDDVNKYCTPLLKMARPKFSLLPGSRGAQLQPGVENGRKRMQVPAYMPQGQKFLLALQRTFNCEPTDATATASAAAAGTGGADAATSPPGGPSADSENNAHDIIADPAPTYDDEEDGHVGASVATAAATGGPSGTSAGTIAQRAKKVKAWALPKCSGATGRVAPGRRDGAEQRFPNANDPELKKLKEAWSLWRLQEPILAAINPRAAALQQCQQSDVVHAATVRDLEASLVTATAKLALETGTWTQAKEAAPGSAETVLAAATRKELRYVVAAIKRKLDLARSPTRPSSVCELERLLERDKNSATCRTVTSVAEASALRQIAQTVCDLDQSVVGNRANDDSRGEAFKSLWGLVKKSGIGSLSAFRRLTEKGRSPAALDHLHHQHWLGDLDFFRPGECAVVDAMHAFFRVVGSTFLPVLLSDLQATDKHCKWKGQQTRVSVFSEAVKYGAGAIVGRAQYSEKLIVKRASSHVFHKLLFDVDWGVGFDANAAKKKSPGPPPAFCQHEAAAQKGWRGLQKLAASLFYFHFYSTDRLADFGFVDNAEATAWMEATTAKMYKLAERLRPAKKLAATDRRPARTYSPFGTRSNVYVAHVLPALHRKGVLTSIINTGTVNLRYVLPRCASKGSKLTPP
jgi:hypothetical protein